MKTYNELLKYGIDRAEATNKEESAVRILLLHFSNMESYELLTRMNEEFKERDAYLEALSKYIDENIPVQHLIGYEYFYGHKFVVNNNVLIPRFETEELVANVLMKYDEVFNGADVSVVDIGTGSGCLGVTLAKEETGMTVTCTDISEEALETAKMNAKNLEVNIEFLHGDMLEPIKGRKFDIIVSNPPYIPEEEYVESLVKDNEPHVALFGGSDGLKFYRIIIEGAKALVKDKFIIAFEHAYDKKEEMMQLAKLHFPDAHVEVLKDMQGRDRMTFIVKE